MTLLFIELDDPGTKIAPEVVVGINLLIVAGRDTKQSSIGSAVWHLGTYHPEDRQRPLDEPELLPIAVEELLRREYSDEPSSW